VVFGSSNNTAIPLSAIAAGTNGFVINGQDTYDYSGNSVSSAGDINGDGLDDLLIGASRSDPTAGGEAGRSYVVFGKTTGTSIDLSAIAVGNGGFVINGQCDSDRSGTSVASAGDVNGDGLVDLIIGANLSDPAIGSNAGRSYVVFGKTTSTAIDLSEIAAGTGGFVLNGQAAGDQSGGSVASAGDVNGDGLADLIVGARYATALNAAEAGRSFVVFGKTSTTAINLSAVSAGTGGFVLKGQTTGDQNGYSVASAGDVNGDGLADLIVSAKFSDPSSGNDAGRTYVVFGKTSSTAIDLSNITAGTGGFVINGQTTSDESSTSVASAGDINGDGLADLIVGVRNSDTLTANYAGRSYVIFGKTNTSEINLSAIANSTGGFVINGQADFDNSGFSVASAGDINGDGLNDLIIGAPYSDPASVNNAGRSYVVFGSTSGAFHQNTIDQLGSSGADTLIGTSAAETLVGGAGDDTLTGAGGTDVLYGGAGDDSLVLSSSNFSALAAGVTDGQLARIDGGSGLDTLVFSGSDITLDLTAITNQGASNPHHSSRIESIERIDLTGSGNNTLTLSLNDVLDMSGMNLFNNTTGWTDGTYDLAAGGANGVNPEQRHQLVIDGNAGDVVNASGWGTSVGNVTNNGHTYDVYNQGTYAQLLIDSTISATVI
jgi:hypothetical protein